MSKWKLSRQQFGNEEYELSEGQITIGRGINNLIKLSSIVISRNHCFIHVKADEIFITDSKSSNGVYVGRKKIPPNIPYKLTNNDIIGFGWTNEAAVENINDSEKHVYKLIEYGNCPKTRLKRKLSKETSPVRLSPEIENNLDAIEVLVDIVAEHKKAEENESSKPKKAREEPILIEDTEEENEDLKYVVFKDNQHNIMFNDEIVLSDSDYESEHLFERLSQNSPGRPLKKLQIKVEKSITSEENSSYSQIDDDIPIELYESYDLDEENDQEMCKSPQTLPPSDVSDNNDVKLLKEIGKISSDLCDNNDVNQSKEIQKYSSDLCDNNDVNQSKDIQKHSSDLCDNNDGNQSKEIQKHSSDLCDNNDGNQSKVIQKHSSDLCDNNDGNQSKEIQKHSSDLCDNSDVNQSKDIQKHSSDLCDNNDGNQSKEIQKHRSDLNGNNDMKLSKEIEKYSTDFSDKLNMKLLKEIEKYFNDEGSDGDEKPKDSEKNVHPIIPLAKNSNKSCKKKQIKKPLIQTPKNTPVDIDLRSGSKNSKRNTRSSKKTSNSSKKNILTNSQKEERRNKLKEISRKEKEKQSKTTDLNTTAAIQGVNEYNDNGNTSEISETINTNKPQQIKEYSKNKYLPPPQKSIQIIDALHQPGTSKRTAHVQKPLPETSNVNLPLKKIEKKVRFREPLAEFHNYIIEPGSKMRKIGSIKKELRHFLIDGPKRDRVSQKKLALMSILNWNTRWLEEQMKYDFPPPIIEKENLSMLFLSFKDHQQYQGQVRNLLLLEIWEYITQGYKDNKRKYLHFKIESLPSKPPRERYHELFTICVQLDISTSDMKLLPREGDVMIIKSRSENIDKWRFSFVYNVTYMSSSANIKTYSLSMYVKYADQIEAFSLGEYIFGGNIANINNIVLLFEAMERLAESPLRKIILQPEPCQYPIYKHNDTITTSSKWTATLNASQCSAVRESVSAALDNTPALRMVQGPPGTGKSSVICAMVMSYFYDGPPVRQSNRGKILICATSNAAVDELVIKLLKMLEKLPPEERFRMVRVGRLESMHVRARDISSQTLAKRELARVREGNDPTVQQQIDLYTAKMNRWRTERSEDPARTAYCEDRAANCARQIELLRGGGEASPRRLLAEERRLVEGADVIATTLSSAVNHKMRRVTGIELCIVDEAGQAIEPETLLPLTLGVTKLTLVGDPQQLPGFICSQRAKKYGLDKSLFSRLSSCSEDWEHRPAVLLDRQYRMHPAIADYPNRAFYAGRVHSVPPASVRLDLPSYCILAVPGDKRDPWVEVRGASSAAAALALAARAHHPPLDVAVITPYVAHRDHIRKYLGDLMRESGSAPVEVNTVDSFQGQERDVVVVSVGRRHGVGFLAEAGRMNVLLTRARHVLLVCLDTDAVRENKQWRTLVEDAQNKKLFSTLPHRMCQSSSRRTSPEDMLNFLKKLNKNAHKSHTNKK